MTVTVPKKEDTGSDGGGSLPVLGSEAFDAWIAHLHRVLEHFKQIRSEHAGASARAATASRNDRAGRANESSARSDPAGTGQSSVCGPPGSIPANRGHINRDLSALDEANERVASGAHDQSEAVSRTATSVEALSDRIDRISRNAGEAADACERARQEAQQGLDQVHSVIEGMDRLLTRIEANGRKVRRLEDRSTEIGVIVELIRGISSRTDMLALNATIESIRAGEHGRGFAIIAEEIRKLAERAAAATREIGTLVEAIQADTQESIRGPERGTGRDATRVATTSRDRYFPGADQPGRREIGPAGRGDLPLDQRSGPDHAGPGASHAADLRRDPADPGADHAGPHIHQGPEPIVRALAAPGRRDPIPDCLGRPMRAGLRPPKDRRSSWDREHGPAPSSPRSGPPRVFRVRHDPGREGVGSERSR